MPRVHLVSYATRRFRLRQLALGWSARCNRIADTVTAWDPRTLLDAGFETCAGNIRLDERGSGFWAWKPFVISKKIAEVPDGDVVVYCDVGRLYPFKLLDQPIDPYLQWMDANAQDCMPGVLIPWEGPSAAWTKRHAFVATGTDTPAMHSKPQVQASFSLWRASAKSRAFINDWFGLCMHRDLISDDPSPADSPELPGFRAHRHDQALLSLCCHRKEISGLFIGETRPAYDARHPSEVSRAVFGRIGNFPTPSGKLLKAAMSCAATAERLLRKGVKFGKPIHE